jgi:5,10-methylenetetrahydrofolate reductase
MVKSLSKNHYQLSVELEPPELYHPEKSSKALVNSFLEKISELSKFVDWISITNRHIYNMGSLTACKKALNVLRQNNKTNINLAMHLTTRQNVIDTYKQLIDIQEVGLSYLMPLLGDPRGPKLPGYFENSLDILRYTSYLTTGDESYLDQIGKRLDKLLSITRERLDQLRTNFRNNCFKLGSVLDPNPVRLINGKIIPIRHKELALYPKKLKSGAKYFMTQAIFSADYYFDFIDEIDNSINKFPIGIGLIPTRLGLSERIGVPIEKKYIKRLQSIPDKKTQLHEGNKITNEILQDLLYRGSQSKDVQWIHIYSFGSLNNVYEILDEELEKHLPKSSEKDTQESRNSIFLRSI